MEVARWRRRRHLWNNRDRDLDGADPLADRPGSEHGFRRISAVAGPCLFRDVRLTAADCIRRGTQARSRSFSNASAQHWRCAMENSRYHDEGRRILASPETTIRDAAVRDGATDNVGRAARGRARPAGREWSPTTRILAVRWCRRATVHRRTAPVREVMSERYLLLANSRMKMPETGRRTRMAEAQGCDASRS